ncbi:energy-coupling factor ABC transporter permease [Halopseudomonas sabulinigri]|uniref:Energy-coupling factor ABC transporter permease n=1 Tax=Halopseudomonas sabulinigri TaxID=472181 RepID=A0ABP9ZNW0_9GAMM
MLSAALLTPGQLLLGTLLYVFALLGALTQVRWVELIADTRRHHLFFGSVFALFALWLVRREFDNGLTVHFIGMTAVMLLLDWPLAIVAGTLAQIGLCLLGLDDLAALGVNGLLRVLVPVAVTLLLSRTLESFQPRNLFLYIFISGFFAAGLAAVATVLVGMGLLSWSGALQAPSSLVELMGYLLLVMFPEGFINGTAVAALIVFCPDWVDTFNTDRYLQEPFDSNDKS